jgi:murein DD-endopeptidase MepM/ murein hydrolase activator NlpD
VRSRLARIARRPAFLAGAAAMLVGVPVAGAAVLAGRGDGDGEGAQRAAVAEDDIDRLIAEARGRARAVEPDAGLPGGVVVVEAGTRGVRVREPGPGSPGVSPGAPTDAQVRADLEAQEREQAKVERVILNSNAPIRPGSGRFIWPITGSLTSPFGPRSGRLHAGIDIAAPTGTAIRAADTGQVVIAGWQGGYGNYTCIRHTRTLSTCYAHQSRLLVQPGQTVFQGNVIGAVGSTGNSTGPHLHFEVRINGQPVDPMAYL